MSTLATSGPTADKWDEYRVWLDTANWLKTLPTLFGSKVTSSPREFSVIVPPGEVRRLVEIGLRSESELRLEFADARHKIPSAGHDVVAQHLDAAYQGLKAEDEPVLPPSP